MATATLPYLRAQHKPTRGHLAVVSLRDFVRRFWPAMFKDSCEYTVEGRTVYRQKRFAGDVVDIREVGTLPDGVHWAVIHTFVFEGYIVGDEASIKTARSVEKSEWKIKSKLQAMFAAAGRVVAHA